MRFCELLRAQRGASEPPQPRPEKLLEGFPLFKKWLSVILCGTIVSGAAPALARCQGDNCTPIVICEWVNVPCGSTPEGGKLYCLEWRCVEDCRDCEMPVDDGGILGGNPDFPEIPELPDFPFDPEPF